MAYVFTSVEIKYNFFDLMIKEPYTIKRVALIGKETLKTLSKTD